MLGSTVSVSTRSASASDRSSITAARVSPTDAPTLNAVSQAIRQAIGVDPQNRLSERAIARVTPALPGLFSLVTVWVDETLKDGWKPRRADWYAKSQLTISEALAIV